MLENTADFSTVSVSQAVRCQLREMAQPMSNVVILGQTVPSVFRDDRRRQPAFSCFSC